MIIEQMLGLHRDCYRSLSIIQASMGRRTSCTAGLEVRLECMPLFLRF